MTTAEAAIAVGRSPSTIRSWDHKRLINAYGTGRHRRYDMLEVQAVHDRLRSAKIAGSNRRLVALVRDTPLEQLTSDLTAATLGTVSVVSHALDDIELRPGDYALPDADAADAEDRAESSL